MNWNQLTNDAQLAIIDQESTHQPIAIFKHSTRCSISSAALNRMERGWVEASNVKAYYLDLLAYRSVSNAVAQHYGIEHQSPQVLLIKNGKCVYSETHMAIEPQLLSTI